LTGLKDGNYTYSESCGDTGLNEPKQEFNIVVDSQVPSFSNRNPLNNTNFTISNIQLNISINDTYSQNMSLSANFSGIYKLNFSSGYTSNSIIIYNLTLSDGFYIYSISANDTAGNENTTQNFTFTVATDTTPPNISLISPQNTSAVTLSNINENIDFKFFVNESSSVCNLFYDNVKIGNSTNSLGSATITSSVSNFGIGRWFVNCTDSFNNAGQSHFFMLDVIQGQTTGGGATASPATGSGGGLSQPAYNSSFGKDYVCSKVNVFINSHANNYTYNEIEILQSEILKDTGYEISKLALSDYIDNSESYCNISRQKHQSLNIPAIQTNFLSISDIKNYSIKVGLNLTWNSYLPIKLYTSSFDYDSESPDSKSIINFLSIPFVIKPSDPYSDTPNFNFYPRIVPLAGLTIAGFGGFWIRKSIKIKKTKKERTDKEK
ncbi:MAG: hypothetical protein AABY22_10700, partial [Nanoarchaeota archaeon]